MEILSKSNKWEVKLSGIKSNKTNWKLMTQSEYISLFGLKQKATDESQKDVARRIISLGKVVYNIPRMNFSKTKSNYLPYLDERKAYDTHESKSLTTIQDFNKLTAIKSNHHNYNKFIPRGSTRPIIYKKERKLEGTKSKSNPLEQNSKTKSVFSFNYDLHQPTKRAKSSEVTSVYFKGYTKGKVKSTPSYNPNGIWELQI